MKVNNLDNKNSFNARCKAIKYGQDVVHSINTELPHFRLTLHRKIFNNLYNRKIYKENAEHDKLISIINNLLDEFFVLRKNLHKNIFNVFELIKKHKLGNCWEDSLLAGIILRINGYKNIYTAELQKGEVGIDHIVCIYNKDDSPIVSNNIHNNKTIVLDAWSGIVDFAGNYFNKIHNNVISEELEIPQEGKFYLKNLQKIKINNALKEKVHKNYPKLIIQNNDVKKTKTDLRK